MKRFGFLLLIASTASIAGVVFTTVPGTFDLFRTGGTVPLASYPTPEACETGMRLLAQPGADDDLLFCKNVTRYRAHGVCDDVPPPIPAVDTDGFTYVGRLDPALKPGSDTEYEITLATIVSAPFPGCWAEAKVPQIPEPLQIEFIDAPVSVIVPDPVNIP